MNKQNTINVTADNIFPIIKKFLYSDNEIFIRELISNSVDACTKLKTLCSLGKIKNNYDDTKNIIYVIIDNINNLIIIKDNGIGMNKAEIEKYINQIAFSGAEDFVKLYKDDLKENENNSIIGHFGLGFYSSFMISDKVEIFSKSYKKNSKPVHWICEGSPKFILNEIDDIDIIDHGTKIILHVNNQNKSFLDFIRLKELLLKYCKFISIPIHLQTLDRQHENDIIINNQKPLWLDDPLKIEDENYIKFYKYLYPLDIQDPLFWIHLNIDYPFKLNGILFFPKKSHVHVDMMKNKIHLYQNQIFVTDNLEGIVPEFLMFLCGVIDSPNIPLNVSRSYLQSDDLVKKISNYISRKFADKLIYLFNNNRKNFENKWEEIRIVIEYGMLTDENFFNKLKSIFLYKTIDNNFYTLDEYIDKIRYNQTNKEKKIIILYTIDKKKQYLYVDTAIQSGYNVLEINTPLISHFIQKIENENNSISFVRVDSSNINDLINKEDQITNKLALLTDDQKNIIKELFSKELNPNNFTVILNENMLINEMPIMIYIPEKDRRITDIKYFNSNIDNINHQKYHVIINPNHKLMYKIVNTFDKVKKNKLIKYCINLALISQNLLTGEDLSKFIKNGYQELYM